MIPTRPASAGLLALGLLTLLPAPAQTTDPARQSARERMWPAPTAEDWRKPCLITWQRTWADALAVARETGKPILVCVNMDGEIASEHYAGVRYRQPEIAKLYEPYVCVIASVYRHTPRDFDEQGRRIPCPRFGCVTCGEHIAIEPTLYEKFFDGRRIAPRHIMVELDGSESYDVYYAPDTASVFRSIEEGPAGRTTPVTTPRGDRSILERVASRDIGDRVAVEQSYAQGDAELRRSLLEAAARHPDTAPVGLLRLAVFGLDQELARSARRALAQANSPDAVDLIGEALRVPMPADERDGLIGALGRLAETSPQARTLAVVHQGLASRSKALDVEQWSAALAKAGDEPEAERPELFAQLDYQAEQAEARPQDAGARLDFAEASLALAADPKTKPRYVRLFLEDAHRAALQAEQLGAKGWRVDATVALAAFRLGRRDEALERAAAAVATLPADSPSRLTADVLALFAEARQRAIARAVRDKQPWPPEWLTDVHAAYSVLARHPLGNDVHVVSHYDFLKALGGGTQPARILDAGLARFPDSALLHDRLRAQILEEKGVAGLEAAYEARLAAPDASPNAAWFAGYTALVAAEFHRRAQDAEKALAAYERGIAHYERAARDNPAERASADHFIAMALAGRARIALEQKEYARALEDILASFTRRPDAAATLDGLNISPVDTAKMLLAKLREQQLEDAAKRLDAALAALDPALLELPAYEREGPAPRRRRGR
jgi:hypothetical protein